MIFSFTTQRGRQVIALLCLVPSLVSAIPSYLYRDDPQNLNSVITEVEDDKGTAYKDFAGHRIVQFYSPFCVHCLNEKDYFLQLAGTLQNQHPQLKIFAVSCSKHAQLCRENNVDMYPSFFTMKKGERQLVFNQLATDTLDTEHLLDALFPKEERVAPEKGEPAALFDGIDESRRSKERGNTAAGLEKGMLIEAKNGDPTVEREPEKSLADSKDDNASSASSGGGADDDGEQATRKKVEAKKSKKKKKRSVAGDEEATDDARTKGDDDASDTAGDDDSANRKKKLKAKRRKNKKPADDDEDEAEEVAGDDLPADATDGEDDDDDIVSDVKKQQANQLNNLLDKPAEPLTGLQKYEQHMAEWKGKISANKQNFHPIKAVDGATDTMSRHANGVTASAKIKISEPSVVERLPVLKYLARKKMSLEEELILDASLSFVHGLRNGVFPNLDDGLDPLQVNALENWLLLLRVTLPEPWALHDLIDDLLENLDFVSRGAVNMEGVLQKHALPRISWSKSCQSSTASADSFHCGFWKLLHVMSVGIAEHRGGSTILSDKTKRVKLAPISPGEAADTVREYVSHFFECTKCAVLFLERYDDCSYKRCERLTDEVEGASDSEWKELANYFWQFHNEISIRILREQTYHAYTTRRRSMSATAGLATTEDEARAVWPSVTDCYACYNDDGAFNKNAIFLHLESMYWPAADLYTETSRFLMYEVEGSKRYGWPLFFLSVFILWFLFINQTVPDIPLIRTVVLEARKLVPKRNDAIYKRSD